MCLTVCYLPPNESSRPIYQEIFFDNLLQQVYCNQNKGYIIILGDFNSRCGPNNDYIEGVDDIVPRPVIMLNGRIGVNDCTYISPWGR